MHAAEGLPPRKRLHARRGWLALWLSLAWGCTLATEAAELSPRQAATVETAYLINFLRYAEWPGRPAEGPLLLSVVGSSRVAEQVAEIAAVAGSVEGRELQVRRVAYPRGGSAEAIGRAVAQLSESHLVYIDRSASRSASEVVEALHGEPVLTVANIEGFVAGGGMLELFRSGRNIVFAANAAALQGAGVVMSSRVLQLARQVEGAGR